jgi:hypothetical protein
MECLFLSCNPSVDIGHEAWVSQSSDGWGGLNFELSSNSFNLKDQSISKFRVRTGGFMIVAC